MSTLIYMKVLEKTPVSYDRGMRLLTLGRIDRIKHEIASSMVEPGHEILEIGCGTGALAGLLSARGAHVVAIDISEIMLAEARKNVPQAEFIHMTATEIDRFDKGRFDRIIATLSFSELSEDELDLVLGETFDLLTPGGSLIVADEVPLATWWQRLLARCVRWPLLVLTFLLTRNTTHALKDFVKRLEETGYRIVGRKSYLCGTLTLVRAVKR